MVTTWQEYLRVPNAGRDYGQCQRLRGSAFAPLRECLRRVVSAMRPKSVACLGAGVLNDIPYWTLVHGGAGLYFVDWFPGIVESGIARSLIRREGENAPRCVYCALGNQMSGDYCRRYVADDSRLVCKHYESAADDPPNCAAFERGSEPRILQQDVMAGYATAFGTAVPAILDDARSWRQALRRASDLAKRAEAGRTNLDIADGAIDLVVSSLVISQFESEPYGYFSKQAAELLGPPSPGEKNRLQGPLENLRSHLLRTQIDRHFDEIDRILAPAGRCFLSFETSHFDGRDDQWFLVNEMLAALGILGRRYDFDFDFLAPREMVVQYQGTGGSSVVYAFLLRSKKP